MNKFQDFLMHIIYFFSEKIMYTIAYLVNEIHLNYFIYPITLLLTFITTIIIILLLKIFGIHDNIQNDKIILGIK